MSLGLNDQLYASHTAVAP